MRLRTPYVILMLALGFTQRIDAKDVKLDCRVWPYDDVLTLMYQVENRLDAAISFRDFNRGFYIFDCVALSESPRREGGLGRPTSRVDPFVKMPAGSSRHWMAQANNIPLYERMSGYFLLTWQIAVEKGGIAPPICLGIPDKGGNIRRPVVDPKSEKVEVYAGFINLDGKSPEVSFLFLNGSKETVTIEKPLSKASRIVATAPAIEYTGELFLAEQTSEEVAIETGKVGEWRIPWHTIRDLIPENELSAIKAADGKLDLVWKVGEYQSLPLPIFLAEPESD